MSYVLLFPNKHNSSPLLHNTYIFGFSAASGLKRSFSFCRFPGRGREELELLLTRNFKWKLCIIEPHPSTCFHVVERLWKYSWNIFIYLDRIVWQNFATSHHNVMLMMDMLFPVWSKEVSWAVGKDGVWRVVTVWCCLHRVVVSMTAKMV